MEGYSAWQASLETVADSIHLCVGTLQPESRCMRSVTWAFVLLEL